MGKTRDLLKKIKDTKRTFHAKMCTKRKEMARFLTETDEIKKRWKNKQNNCAKNLHDPDNHDGVVTHLQPDILECEVKWVLGNITMNKVSGGDGIQAELFQILKDNAVKVLHSICQQI